MKLDKTEIARRQLGTALAMFLEDSDPVSVHTLACAGCEIAEYLTRKAGEEPFSTHALLTFPDLNIGKIRQLQNNTGMHSNMHRRAVVSSAKTANCLSASGMKSTITRCLSGGTITCLRSAHCPSKHKYFRHGISRYTPRS
jgi:hypothetical protein